MLTPPPWTRVHGGADRYLARRISEYAVETPGDLLRLRLVSRLFDREARCHPRGFARACRRVLVRWFDCFHFCIFAEGFRVRGAPNPHRLSYGPRVSSDRHLLRDMAAWVRQRRNLRWSGQDRDALGRIAGALSRCQTLRTWAARYRELRRVHAHIEAFDPRILVPFLA